MKRKTIGDVAKESGYSIATVSRVLNNGQWITGKARKNVIAAARKIGYLQSYRTVAVILPSLLCIDSYSSGIVGELSSLLESKGFLVEVISLNSLNLLQEQNFCGAISAVGDSGLERIWSDELPLPLVCINTRPRHLDGIFTVGSNDAQGMRLAVGHLIQLGHRRIGRLGGGYSFGDRTNWNSHARDLAFRDLMAEHGLSAELRVAVEAQSVPEAVRQLLDMGVTAMILLNEGMELEVMHALRLLKIRVPEMLSVVGWSSDAVAPFLEPSLTNLEQNYTELVRCGCEIFQKLLNGEPVAGDVLVDYRFRVRSSTAPPPVA